MGVLLYCYAGGWIVTTIVVAMIASRLQDQRAPAPHPMLMCIVAGAVWPVLVVALAEAGAFALTTEALHDEQHLRTVDA